MQRPDSHALDAEMLTPHFYANPYPVYDRFREEAPIYWSNRFQAWILTRYTDVAATIRDTQRFSNARRVPALLEKLPPSVQSEIGPLKRHFSIGLVQSDPPDHTRIRALVNKTFTPRMVEDLRPRIQAITDELLDNVIATGSMDVIADFAYPLPATVICEFVGVPVEARDHYKSWSSRIFRFLGTGRPELTIVREAQQALLELEQYFRDLFVVLRRQPKDDLLSHLVRVEVEGQRLSEDELLALCSTFVSAGHETTTNLIGMGVLALLQHPAQLERLRTRPDLMRQAVEEMLRYESPLQRNLKVATVDVALGDQQIRAGDLMFPMLGAANRDPAQFPNPHSFDLERLDNRHLAFGLGPHFCLGAPLARLECQLAIETLLRRLDSLELVNNHFDWGEDIALRGLKSLPISFTPA